MSYRIRIVTPTYQTQDFETDEFVVPTIPRVGETLTWAEGGHMVRAEVRAVDYEFNPHDSGYKVWIVRLFTTAPETLQQDG
jgi:hypothetical protein